MQKIFFSFIIFGVLFFSSACGPTAEEKIQIQKTNDSIAKVEAEALEQEATTAEHMQDSADVANGDTVKKAVESIK